MNNTIDITVVADSILRGTNELVHCILLQYSMYFFRVFFYNRVFHQKLYRVTTFLCLSVP